MNKSYGPIKKTRKKISGTGKKSIKVIDGTVLATHLDSTPGIVVKKYGKR